MSRAEGLKVGIVASDPKEWHVERLTSELKARGAEAYVLPATRCRAGAEANGAGLFHRRL
jgi:hypothetical protein